MSPFFFFFAFNAREALDHESVSDMSVLGGWVAVMMAELASSGLRPAQDGGLRAAGTMTRRGYALEMLQAGPAPAPAPAAGAAARGPTAARAPRQLHLHTPDHILTGLLFFFFFCNVTGMQEPPLRGAGRQAGREPSRAEPSGAERPALRSRG